jgi:hypothetical protein
MPATAGPAQDAVDAKDRQRRVARTPAFIVKLKLPLHIITAIKVKNPKARALCWLISSITRPSHTPREPSFGRPQWLPTA